jgi:two-component system, sensor histidine kinase and response regulator
MTASAMSDQRVQCLAAGMDDFLTKPIDLDAFAAALERWTGGPAHRQPVETHPVAEHPLLGADRGAELDRATLTVLDTLRTPDGHSMVDAVITSYTASAPEHVQELTRLLVDGELDAALGTAHRLAGESGTVGATGVCRLAQQLETACGDRATKAELQAQLSLLSAAVPAAVAALHAYQREAFRASGGTAR